MTGMLQFLEYRTGLSHKLCNLYNAATRIREESGLCCQKNLQSAVCSSQHFYLQIGHRPKGGKKKSVLINSFILYLQLFVIFQQVYVYVKIPVNNRINFVDKNHTLRRVLCKNGFITLLRNYLIIYISRNENLLGFYLHIIHIKSVVEFLARVVDICLEIAMAKDKDWFLLDVWMTFLSQHHFFMLLQNKVTRILRGKQHNICPHCIFSVHFLCTNIFCK